MVTGLINTLHPKRGKGLMETIIFIVGILVLFYLNLKEIPVSKELDYMIKALIGYLGYMVGTNKVKKDIKERGMVNNESE